MTADVDVINRHIFSKGNIQASPAEIQQLNSKPPVPFKASYLTGPVDAGYRVFLTGYASKLLMSEKKLEFGRLLERSINSLRSNPRPTDGYLKKGTVDTRILDSNAFSIWYKVHSGQILIYNIEPKESVQTNRDKLEKPDVYKVIRNSQGNWESSGRVSSVNTSYAAVNGQSNNLAKATWLMGAHLDFEFGKGNIKEYTLFHNPSVGFKGDTWNRYRINLVRQLMLQKNSASCCRMRR